MKKAGLVLALVAGAALMSALPAAAQFQRHDYIWARSTNGAPLTLDGSLSEPEWSLADSIVFDSYKTYKFIDGSGFKGEGGFPPTDPNHNVIRFLSVGNQLWMGVTVRDSSIGGSATFNAMDGLLMDIRQAQSTNRPIPAGEHFISWWWPSESGDTAPLAVDKPMRMVGVWRPVNTITTPPTPEQLLAWDARWQVNGRVNTDTIPDQGYTIEMRFDLASDGYNYTQPGGDAVLWNGSIYDADWEWPLANFFHYSQNRTWIGSPWGNTPDIGNVKVLGRSDVTVNSGAAPVYGPDMTIRNGALWPTPTLDGRLDDAVWAHADSINIRWDDAALRASYPGTGKLTSGQFQTTVNANNTQFIQDPADGTVKMFVKGTTLYIGVDARDQFVQSTAAFDRWDGGCLSLASYSSTLGDTSNVDNLTAIFYKLDFSVNSAGHLQPGAVMDTMITSGRMQAALSVGPGTTVDTLGTDFDNGWQAEFAIDLTKLGYPADLGNHALQFGFDLMDGDSFTPFTDSYGTRTWFFKEWERSDAPCYIFMNTASMLTTGVGDTPAAPQSLELLGNFPNPFRGATSLHFRLPQPAAVSVDVFDLQGRKLLSRPMGVHPAGLTHVRVPEFSSKAGVYLYRVHVADAVSGANLGTLSGKMMVVE
jgi:hypothetical protein